MQSKVTRDVRIVFFLSIDMVAGCVAGKTYLLHVKRGDKIHASSPPLIADDGGKLHVNLSRIFTSTLQRQNDWKYKKKPLKVRIEELRSHFVTSLSYDLSKNIVEETFPERRVIIRERDGLTEVHLRLRGVKESLYIRQQDVQTASNASSSSYMREPSTASLFGPHDPSEEHINHSTTSFLVDDYLSVIDSLTGTASEQRSEDIHSETKETQVDKELNKINFDKCASAPDTSLHPLVAPMHRRTGGVPNTISKENFKNLAFTRVSDAAILKGKDLSTLKPSWKRNIAFEDPVHGVIRQICDAVRWCGDIGRESQTARDASNGAHLALDFYLNQDGETLGRFVVSFLAHVVVEVCRETRHIGNWLSLLTHVIYGSILYTRHQFNPCDVKGMSIRIADLRDLDVDTFTTRGEAIIQDLARDLSVPVATDMFWFAGLDYCASTLALLCIHQIQCLCDNFVTLFPFSGRGCISMEEGLVAATAILCSHLHLLLSTLLSQTEQKELADIRNAPPLYRIILGEIITMVFDRVVTVIIEYMRKIDCLPDGSAFHIAFKALKLLISWAQGHFLLSVVSPILMSLVVYCDFVLLPQGLLKNHEYRLYLERFLPSFVEANNSNDKKSRTMISPCLSSNTSDTVAFSFYSILVEFTERGCRGTSKAERGSSWTLVEVLNGDKDDAARVLSAEELFPATGFNGTRHSFSDPSLVLPLLAQEIKSSFK
ncbi:AGP2beta-2 [Trypanosoma cruzi cruzi]|nr:AGP2beta-2 [Trypanosoma cruzi cruzi]